MRILTTIILFLILLLPPTVFAGNPGIFSQPLPDTEKFRCKFCPEEIEEENSITAGLAIVANNNSKFSEYRGYDGNSVSLAVDGQYQLIDEDRIFSLQATNAGTSNRQVEMESRRYGRYQFNLIFDQITRFQSDSSKTVYQGIESDTLITPPVTNTNALANSQAVVALYGTGSEYDIKQQRNRFNVTFKKIFSSKWESRINYRYEKKTGLKTFGGVFGSNYNSALSVILPEPIDYVTQLINLSIGYYSATFKLETGVKGSLFKNSNTKILWDNIYLNNTANEPSKGQAALEPDNQFYQIYALGLIRPLSWISAKGQLSAGKMKQDQTFLRYTINDNLTESDLPKSSLDGSVNTLTGNFRLSLKPIKALHVYANASFDRKDNKTDSENYNYLVLDTTASNSTRTNLPYGYRLYSTSFATDYYYLKNSFLNIGYKYQQKSRTYSEIGKTKTNLFWGKVKQKISKNTIISLKVERSERDASDFSLVSQINPSQNPLMRKYYLADKSRQNIAINFNTILLNDLSFQASMSYATDDYSASVLGVTDATDFSYGIDVSKPLADTIFSNAFVHVENIESYQKGIDFSPQNWRIYNSDTFTTMGLGVDWKEFSNEIDIGSKIIMALSKGEISSERNDTEKTDFPDLTTSRISFELYGSYTLKENMSIKARYLLEKYKESDWHYDDVNATTLNRVLGTQQVSSDYFAHLFLVSFSYSF